MGFQDGVLKRYLLFRRVLVHVSQKNLFALFVEPSFSGSNGPRSGERGDVGGDLSPVLCMLSTTAAVMQDKCIIHVESESGAAAESCVL